MPTSQSTQRKGLYDFTAIESRWQKYWEEHEVFRIPNPGEPGLDTSKPKYYVLDMFPYPSGAGLHVGHPVGYCATDIIARYRRMRGFNVLHPMGFDAFGLPAEQYAVETNVHPAVTTKRNIETYRKQLKMFGFSYDWSREVATCEPSYYKHTQWMFVRMFESWFDATCEFTDADGRSHVGKARPIRELVEALESGRIGVDARLNLQRDAKAAGRREWSELSKDDRRAVITRQRLAYMDEIPVNWCPALGTVLANEEVDNEGRSDRGQHPVFRRPLRQWMLRITKYTERLLDDLASLDWPEPIKIMQRNWVGKSTGAEVVFPLADKWAIEGGAWKCLVDDTGGCGGVAAEALSYDNFPHAIRIYTTRPDTLFGATYMVLAPEHSLVEQVTTPDQRGAVQSYVQTAARKSDMARTADAKEKTGVFTGGYAINPVNGERIPIWVADYVLMGYGTGAIMAVPGGDTRDFEFACAFDLPIRCVNRPPADWIAERLATMTTGLGDRARAGLADVAAEFPELGETIEQCQQRSAQLDANTLAQLRDNVGMDRLITHYEKHPKSWGAAYAGDGLAVNSPGSADVDAPGDACSLDELPTPEAKRAITTWLEENGVGRGAVNYKLRDWLFSRQRYWGEPFPVLHDADGHTTTVADDELPVELPPVKDFKPTPTKEDCDAPPEPPLGRAKDWVAVERDGKRYVRDLNTMPQWAGSCWYFLRFLDPHNTDHFCSAEAERYWMPIDLYVGGAEHAVLHLLYARFWHKVLYDLGHVSTSEPFQKLFNQGMIQGFAFEGASGITIGPDQVEQRGEDDYVLRSTGEPVRRKIAKMSKSLKNVVNPDEIISKYGADTFRIYEMYMGPLEAEKPWNTRDVPGAHKLCQRIWRLVVDSNTGALSSALSDKPADEAALRVLHKTIKRVGEDIEQIKLNTAIAAIFEFVNALTPMERRPRQVIEPFVILVSPFAPHLAEELWNRLGHDKTLAYEPWPVYDEALAKDDEVEIGVQVCGKIKAKIMVASDADEESIKAAAMADESVAAAIAGKTIRKVIVVKGRLVNIVAT